METKVWIAFFSQTGAEIADIAESLGRWPDRIITNQRPDHLRTIDSRIEEKGYFTFSNKPTLEEYEEALFYFPEAIITLHGWLRIMPPEICEKFMIYNGHPGLITDYPELKGKDPQMRAWEGNYDLCGTVLHRVTEGVDEGEIISSASFTKEGLDIDGYFRILREMSSTLWVDFLRDKL